MKKMMSIMAAGLMVIALSAAAHAEDINMVGSTTVLPIAQATAEAFMDEHPNVNITVGGGGSSIGAKALLAGTCDIADCSRPLKSSEFEAAAKNGITPKAHVVAMDGIAVIVHPSNPVSALSLEQIKAIYTGAISNWSEVGGSDKPIVIISRDTSSGTYEAFNVLALEEEKVRPDALMQASNNAVLQTVAQTPDAIGYVGLGYVNNTVKALPVQGILPSKETVLSKKYPISRPLYMYTNGEPKGVVKEYLDFVKGPKGQKIAEEQGFVGLM